jgi:hypothetical protein
MSIIPPPNAHSEKHTVTYTPTHTVIPHAHKQFDNTQHCLSYLHLSLSFTLLHFITYSPLPVTPKIGLICSKMTSCRQVVGAKRAQIGINPIKKRERRVRECECECKSELESREGLCVREKSIKKREKLS